MPERVIETPVGRMLLCGDENGITEIRLKTDSTSRDSTPLLLNAERELTEYFAGRRRTFSVPLSIKGTPFQMRVWQALCTIPYGEVRSYGEIAAAIGSPKAARAVGMANHNNPVPIIVPCHRVIGSNGQLTGYAGGLEMKRYFLELEGYHAET